MLVGYLDDTGAGSDDDLPVAEELVDIWQPGARRHSVASAYAACPQNLIWQDQHGDHDAEAATAISATEVACPVERLLRMALLVNRPQEYAPAPSRKRRRSKQPPTLGELLAALMASPSDDPAPHYKSADRRLGYHEFSRRFANDLGQTIRAINDQAQQLWNHSRREVQNGWAVLGQVSKIMYERVGARTRKLRPVPGQAGAVGDDGLRHESFTLHCLGVLCTWMLDLGLEDPAVMAAVAAGIQGEQLAEVFKGMPLYQHAFVGFKAWVQAKAEALGFGTHACSMELCVHGSLRQRVHVHAWLGPQLDMMAWTDRVHVVALNLADMGWGGVRPHMRVLRPRRAGGALRAEIIGGMYYVLTVKPGTMFRHGSRWPFSDLVIVINYCLSLVEVCVPCCFSRCSPVLCINHQTCSPVFAVPPVASIERSLCRGL